MGHYSRHTETPMFYVHIPDPTRDGENVLLEPVPVFQVDDHGESVVVEEAPYGFIEAHEDPTTTWFLDGRLGKKQSDFLDRLWHQWKPNGLYYTDSHLGLFRVTKDNMDRMIATCLKKQPHGGTGVLSPGDKIMYKDLKQLRDLYYVHR